MTDQAKTAAALTWVVLLSVAALILLAAGLWVLDQPVLESVRAGVGREWRGEAKLLSRYGDFPWLLGAGLVLLAVSLRWGKREWSRILTAMILAGVIAGLSSNLVKLGTGRVRPRAESVTPGWHGPVHEGAWVTWRHEYQAFPSSHAACVFGFFVPLFLSRKLLGAAGLIAAAAVAWSRVQLNAHHVSDVAAGALLGVLAGWIVWRWLVERGGLARWLGPPQAQPQGGVGVRVEG